MSERFSPLHRPIRGTLRVPGDKSISHRAVLLAAIASGSTRVSGLLDSLDVRNSIQIVESLGARVDLDRSVDGSLQGTIEGWGERGPVYGGEPLDCGNSGTTARLMLGLLSGYDIEAVVVGDESLCRRPMLRVTRPLEQMGARFTMTPEGTLPIEVIGRSHLKPIDYCSEVASAQVKSAVMLAALHADGDTFFTEPSHSRDHTERMLPAFGADIRLESDGSVCVVGPAELHATSIDVPGDPSSAAFLMCAAAMVPGSALTIERVSLNETRMGYLKVMRRMGVHMRTLRTDDLGAEPVGDIVIFGDEQLRATVVPASEIPSMIDEVPILALLATTATGTTCFEGVGELRVKESNRLTAIVNGLDALGCKAYVRGDDLYVEGGKPSMPATMKTHGDHRLAICWALAGMCFDVDVTVDDFACAAVSYPGFLEDMAKLTKH